MVAINPIKLGGTFDGEGVYKPEVQRVANEIRPYACPFR